MLSSEQILQLIRQKVHHPASVRELMQVLRVPREERVAFRRQLSQLVSSGVLVTLRGRRYGLPDKMDLVVGRLQTSRSGFGFVVPERSPEGDGPATDIYVPAAGLMEAMNGDRVVARIERFRDGDRPEGRIVQILERGNQTLVGRYELDEAGVGYVLPFDQRVLMDVHIPRDESVGASPGQMVNVEIVRWPTAARGPVGRIIEVLGDVNEPGVDTKIIIRKYGIPDQHSGKNRRL